MALRRLLPKSSSQPESFILKPTTLDHQDSVASQALHRQTSNVSQSGLNRRSLGQKRRREREARENPGKPRELAAVIQSQMSTTRVPAASDRSKSRRSEAQRFRRRIEEAERRLDAAPDCDSTQALDKILDLNIDNWSRHRRESYRDRMSRNFRG
ncbi:hypothetical protein B0H11DRAFT_2276759 [Mycena galericulata]|nr:hypothetical protein B0H11DRAFT_2276759 [Mycena galericulata]